MDLFDLIVLGLVDVLQLELALEGFGFLEAFGAVGLVIGGLGVCGRN
jgi:hypothetical protein